LYTPGSFSANPLVYTWAVSTLNTTPEKRAAAGAIVGQPAVHICAQFTNTA
jgi:hypothetical protein